MADLTAWIEKNRALWTRVYDEVIAPDMEAEWQKREEAHREDLRKREENRLIMLKRMEEEVVKNSQLATENQQLKLQLAESTKGEASSVDPVPAPAGEAVKLPEEDEQLAEKFNELSKKYKDLQQEMKYLRRKNTSVMQKTKDMKESVRAWQEYADRLAAKQKPKHESKTENNHLRLSAIPQIQDARPHVPSSPRSIATLRTPLLPADRGGSSPAPIPPLDRSDEEEEDPETTREHQEPEQRTDSESVTPKPCDAGISHERRELDVHGPPKPAELQGRRIHSGLQASHPSSSQTTVEEPSDPFTRRTQPDTAAEDDDVPEFVSARSVNKRKRGQVSRIEIYGDRSDGTPVKPFRVKEEPENSPPKAHYLMRKDTVDLDIPTTGLLRTPHHARHQRSSSAPMSQHIVQKVPAIPVPTSDAEAAIADVRASSEPSEDSNNAIDEALKELDPNTITEPHEQYPSKRVKVSRMHGQKAHHLFSESGEEPPPTNENELRLPPSLARAKLSRRLHAINEQPPVPPPTMIKLEPDRIDYATPKTSKQAPVTKSRLHEPPKVSNFTPKTVSKSVDRPEWQMKAPETRSSTRKPAKTLSVKQSRLRSKPVEELKPADFKVNPAYNQGYSYAFSETVRKRGERACLPGCTNSQCCGSKFRAFAEAQAPLSASQEEALLEDYLGEAYDNMQMTQMASEERRELILQARAKKMAKDAGKHREAFERRRTPPGFWRIDFPSTQEHEEDRRKAQELEKEVVQERWLEAQRKGGKWMFRDE